MVVRLGSDLSAFKNKGVVVLTAAQLAAAEAGAEFDAFDGGDAEEKPTLPSDYIWIPESSLDDYAKPRLIEILLESLPG